MERGLGTNEVQWIHCPGRNQTEAEVPGEYELNTGAMAGQQSHSPICAALQPYLCLITALSLPPYSPISAMLHPKLCLLTALSVPRYSPVCASLQSCLCLLTALTVPPCSPICAMLQPCLLRYSPYA